MNQNEIIYQVPKQPRQLRLDTIARCNAHCSSCHRFLTSREGEMDDNLLLEILNDVSRWSTPLTEIIPVNYGEFFLKKDWAYILEMIYRKLPRTQIVLPTNGSLLTSQRVEMLCSIPSLKIINFSVNAFFNDTYEQFMKLPAKTMLEIRHHIEQIRALRADITIWVSMVHDPMYQTDYERDMFKSYWSNYAVPQIINAASARRPEKKSCNPVLIPCRSIFSDIVVGFDRKISSCCFDASFSIPLGMYEGDLLRNWWSKEMVEFRELHNTHKRTEIDICKNCTFA